MMRWLMFIALIAGGYFGFGWLIEHPGEVNINWLGLAITLHITLLAALLIVFALVIGYLSVLLWRAATWPTRRRDRKEQRIFRRGLEQLTKSVAALSIGDDRLAEEALKKATAALPNEPLPKLLTAQLLQRQGKQAEAQAEFKSLIHHPSTAGLATRKLIENYMARGEWSEAERLSEDARKENPRDRWLIVTSLSLHARARRASEMLALTEGWQWQSPLCKEERHRYAALAHYLSATGMAQPRKQEQSLRHAVGYAPGFLPAVIAYAELLMEQHSMSRARKWLLDAWKSNPSLLLVSPILLSIAGETPRSQQRLLRPFLRGELSGIHHLLEAKQALAAKEFGRAKSALQQSITLLPCKESMLLMAQIETELNDNAAANSWTARAVDAPDDAAWVCSQCGHSADQWSAHCGSCQSFDTLEFCAPQPRSHSVVSII